jgi:hypothetical protein
MQQAMTISTEAVAADRNRDGFDIPGSLIRDYSSFKTGGMAEVLVNGDDWGSAIAFFSRILMHTFLDPRFG